MYYYAVDIDQGLSCLFCRKQFVDVIKLLPKCGDSICGECYDDLRDQTIESRQFSCLACNETHDMPIDGLSDNKGLLMILNKRKIERPLSEQAKTLKSCVESLRNQRDALESFDKKDYVHRYCDQLEFQVSETISSVVKDLNEIEADLLNEIKQYREKCLDALTVESTVPSKFEQELAALYQEVGQFSAKWNEFFYRLDVIVSDADVDSGLNQAKELEKRIQLMEEQCKMKAFDGKMMICEENLVKISKTEFRKAINLIVHQKYDGIKINEEPSFTFKNHCKRVDQVIFMPNGNVASCSDDGTIKIWSPIKGDVVVETNNQATDGFAMCLLSDGSLASTFKDDFSIKIRDLGQLKRIRSLPGDHIDDIVSLRVLKSGHLASYSIDGTIKIWNPISLDNNPLLTITGHGNANWVAKLFTVLPNDNLAACSRDSNHQEESFLRVWDSKDGQLIKLIPIGIKLARTMLVLSEEQVAVGFDNGTIKIVDLSGNGKSRVKEKAHLYEVTSLAFLSNRNLISTGNDYSNRVFSCFIKVWNLPGFHLLQTVETGHSGPVESLAISPDEKLLATASEDWTVKLWLLSFSI